MNNKVKSFLNISKLEAIRIFRNKYIFGFLLFFPLVVVLLLGIMPKQVELKIAINYDGLDSTNSTVLELINEKVFHENVIEVNSDEQGKELLKQGKINFFISLDSSTTPVNSKFYYDSSSELSTIIQEKFENLQNEYAYETITEFIEDYGIILNDNYFHLIQFEPYDNNELTYSQRLFVIEVGTFLSIVFLFGMAFSVTRDNETGVYKQIAYTPININKYLLCKSLPYFILGLFQSIIMLLLGKYFLNINYQANIFLIFIILLLFVYCTIILGLLISQFKNQIITTFISMFVILLPVFALNINSIDYYPFVFQILLYCFPLTSFMNLFKFLIFNGVINYFNTLILLLQCIVFYCLVVFIFKKRIHK